jgi:hypothetical protein
VGVVESGGAHRPAFFEDVILSAAKNLRTEQVQTLRFAQGDSLDVEL